MQKCGVTFWWHFGSIERLWATAVFWCLLEVNQGGPPISCAKTLMKRQSTPRLETRTKESNMHASIIVENYFVCVMKVKVAIRVTVERSVAVSAAAVHLRATWIFLKRLTKSVYVGTRKMVNYG